MFSKLKILIIEDDKLSVDLLTYQLKSFGEVIVCRSEKDYLRFIAKNHSIDLAFVDLDIEGKCLGFKFAKQLHDLGAYTIIATGHTLKDSIKRGYEYSQVNDYITKPYDAATILNCLERFNSQKNSLAVEKKIKDKIKSNSPSMKDVIEVLRYVHLGQSPVYLFGQTGVGKQIIAELIHELKHTQLDNFYHFNCAAVSDSIIESELFGHEKGSFTGASSQKIGLLEKANGGTLFLDEISTMSKTMQNKLITALELKKFRRVGSTNDVHSNFRLIAATSSDLSEEVSKGNFRSDLFFRLNGTHIKVPSLKERKEDLEGLIDFFLQQLAKGRAIYLAEDVLKMLKKYDWPGNVRELRNLIQTWVERNKSKVELSDIPTYIVNNEDIFNKSKPSLLNKKQINYIKDFGLNTFINQLKEESVDYFYQSNSQKIRKTARDLQIHTDQIYFHLNKNTPKQSEMFQ